MLAFVAGNQSTGGVDDSPPGKSVGSSEDVADGPGGAWEARFGSDLAVGDDIAWLQGGENPTDGFLEVGLHGQVYTVPKSRSPMSPSPGRM